MAYDYGNPLYNSRTYPRYFPQQDVQIQQPQMHQGLNWVSGEIGAKAYAMAPGNTVILMDSESNKFYIKSTDAAGMPTMKTYQYEECLQNNAQASYQGENDLSKDFITRKEFDEMRAKYEDLLALLEDKGEE